MHFYGAAGTAEIKPLWDSIEEGLFLHVRIEQTLWNKTAGLETPLSYNFQNQKASSPATHRLPAIVGVNKQIHLFSFDTQISSHTHL